MSASRSTRAKDLTAKRAHRLWIPFVFCLLGAFVWGGCTVEKNYDLLSFFFDGVPDPNAPPGTRPLGGGLPASYMAHKPYEEGRCTECHPKLFVPVQSGSEVCMKCHEGIGQEQIRTHGPVAAQACLFCHSPHDSVYPSLLRAAPRQLCRQCHDVFLLGSGRVEAHSDDERNCLDCHGGHGGSNPFFLHQSVMDEISRSADPLIPSDDEPGEDG